MSLRGARPPRLSESDGGQAEGDAAISSQTVEKICFLEKRDYFASLAMTLRW
jgi:hypothetical protein